MGIPAPWLKGGPPTHLPLLVEYLKKETEFEIKTFYFGSQKSEGAEKLFSKFFHTLKVLFQFIQLIITFKPQIIHLNSAFDKTSILRDIPFCLISKLSGTPLLFKVHGSHNGLLYTKSPILTFLIKLYFFGASKVGVLSEFERNEFIQRFGNASKLIVVKNIVRNANMELIKNNSKMNPQQYDALFVSRIEKGKGLEDLLHAIPYIIKTYPSFLLAIAGSGRALNQYKKLADNLKIQLHIKWLGHIQNEQLKDLFSESKTFIFTSHFPEGMPMSMVEALFYGIPVITTKTRFAVSYLKEEQNVLFIDTHQPQQIAEKLLYLNNNPSIKAKMTIENKKFLRNFSQKAVGQEFSCLYHEMIKN